MNLHTIQSLSDRLCDELELRSEPNRNQGGRALLISWVDELSPKSNELLGNFIGILRGGYHYTVDRLFLSDSAQRDLQFKILDLLQQSETSNIPAVIYYHGDVCGEGDISWVSVSLARLQRLIQQSPAEVLVLVDRQETLTQSDLEDDDNDFSSFQSSLPLDRVQGKLEIIDSGSSAATDAFVFNLQLSGTLQKPQNEWYNAQDLFRYLSQRDGLGSITYENLSSPGDGESIVLARVANPTDLITFTFDITITTVWNETTLSEQILHWCLSCPPATRAMSLSTHSSTKRIGEKELTNLLTLRVQALESEPTKLSFAQWLKQAPDRLLVSSGLPFHVHDSATSSKKSRRVPNDLTNWVEQRNQSSELTAASSTRQGNYRKVLVLPVRWKECDFRADIEIGLLRSVLKDHFCFTIEPDLVLQSNDDAESQLIRHFDKYIPPRPTDTLASQDLIIVIYNGHGADGFYNNTDMILAPNDGHPTKPQASVNWTPTARALDRAACDVLQILDCCFAGTATKGSGNTKDTGDFLDTIHDDTESSDYRGTNEYLASSSRDSAAHAGQYSSMRPFADELRRLAEQGKPFTVQEWHHRIDTAIAASNVQSTASTSSRIRREFKGYSSPAYKLHPIERLGRSIILKPRTLATSQQQDLDAQGFVYARVKLVNGHETETVYFTENEMRKQLS